MDDTNNGATGEVVEATTTEAVTTETAQAEISTSWLDGLSDGYRNDPNISKFNSPDALAKGYTEISKMIGKDKVVLPSGEGAEYDAQMDELFSRLGMPETADGYGLENIDLSEHGINATLETGDFAEVARQLRMTPEQAKGVLDYYVNDVTSKNAQSVESQNQSVNEARVALRNEFGAAYDESMAAANSIFKEHFPSLEGSDLVRDPNFVKDLVKLSKNFGETKLGKMPSSGAKTPGEAKAEKTTLMQSEAYTNQMHPEHDAAVDKYFSLLEMEMAGNR